MFYYGFDRTSKRCIFSSSGAVTEHPDVVVITAEESYDITAICFGLDGETPVILPREATSEEVIAKVAAQRLEYLALAAGQISLLTDVVELGNDPMASYKLTEWRAFRVKVYAIDPTTAVEWPPIPEL